MAKPITSYVCNNCGKRLAAYLGVCPQCHEYGTIEKVIETREPDAPRRPSPAAGQSRPQRLAEVEMGQEPRYAVSSTELGRVLGGGIVPGSITLIAGDPGIGKCLTAETRVLDPSTGDFLPIIQWAKNRRAVVAIDEQSLCLTPDQSLAFFDRGVQPIVEIKTELGRTLRCTPSHPVLTPTGWQAVGTLRVGNFIASPRALPYFGNEMMPDEQVKLIAYILSDGSAQSAITVTTCLPEVVQDLETIAAAFGMRLRAYEKKNNRAKTYRFVTNKTLRIELRQSVARALRSAQAEAGISWTEWARRANVSDALLNMWRRAESVPSKTAMHSLADGIGIPVEQLLPEARYASEKKTPIARFLEAVGLRYHRAADKVVPDCIFRLPREKLALFLKTLFTCDGSVYVNAHNTAGISYGTISHRLAEDVQHLLLRFGFVATLRTRSMKVNDAPYTAYEVVLLGTTQVQRFLDQIGITGREEACQKISAMAPAKGASTRRDLIPLTDQFWEHLYAVRGDLSFKMLSQRVGVRIMDRRHEQPLCRTTVQKLADYSKDSHLAVLSYNDVYWDRITRIAPADEAAVYDISVDHHPSFVANDLIVHNSTLMAQLAASLAQTVGKVLYVSGEESVRQIKMRADRLDVQADDLYLVTESSLETILDHVQAVNPAILIVDSIQTTFSDDKPSAAGTVTQVRECAARFQLLAKSTGIGVFLVGHVTKEGTIAGPRVLEHIVDTVLYLEGDPFHAYRLLRSVKNRFGATSEVGVFEMRSSGLVEVINPSEVFLAERVVNAAGSTIVVTMEGTRPLLVEVQALASSTTYPNPRRTANGIDFNRLQLLTAVLTRRVGLRLADQDVFVNVIGGLTVEEPAADLAIAVAIASSVWDVPVPADLAIVGEVGLSGELRAVGQLPARLREASKLGFRRLIVPKSIRRTEAEAIPDNLQVIPVRTLREALDVAVPRDKPDKAAAASQTVTKNKP